MPPAATAAKTSPALPIQHRCVGLDPEQWKGVKAAAKRRGVPVRMFVAEALDAELPGVLASLKGGVGGKPKFVRLPMDENTIGRLNLGRRQVGVPAVALLRLCMARHAAAVAPTAAS